MKATNIRKGNVLLIDNQLYKVMNMTHVTPGKGHAHVQTKLRNLADGIQTEKRFNSSDNVEKAYLETKEMQYLYSDGEEYHFMDTKSYEQVAVSAELLGDAVNFIVPDTMVMMQFHDLKPLGIDLPSVVELKVVDVPPGVRDATASAQKKPATMETGIVVQVPAFIDNGEILRINTLDGTYSERAKK